MKISDLWQTVGAAKNDLQVFRQENPYDFEEENFARIENDLNHLDSGTTADESIDFRLWKQGMPCRQECVRDYLQRNDLIRPGMRILEVGGGRNAFLSRLLAAAGCEMTCIDPKAESSAKNTNIHIIKEPFDYKKADISQYQLIVGQEPCDATEHIVRACLEQDGRCIIFLCGVAHAYLSGGIAANGPEWHRYLAALDRERVELTYEEVYSGYMMGVLKIL